jgi:hypothetical protein
MVFMADESDFLQQVFVTARKVARGEQKAEAARTYLEGLG